MALVLQEKEEKKKAGKEGKIKEKGRSPVAGAGDPLWPPPRLLEHNLECPHYNLTESHRHKRPRSPEKVTLGAVKCYWASIFLVIV